MESVDEVHSYHLSEGESTGDSEERGTRFASRFAAVYGVDAPPFAEG